MRNSIIFPVISALLCGMICTGCGSDDTTEPDDGIITVDGLCVMGDRSGSVVKLSTVSAGETGEAVFTGDDIVSFEVGSGEIVFNADEMGGILSRISLHSELHFFIDGQPVFAPPIRIHPNFATTFDDFDLQFRLDDRQDIPRIWLTDVYMNIDTLPEVEREIKRQEMAANQAKREKELDILIKYLDDAGKAIFPEPLAVEPRPDLTGIRIKENPCEKLQYVRQIGYDFDTALDSIRLYKRIPSETKITKMPLEVMFDKDDRLFYGIVYKDEAYTDVLDTKGYYYLRTYDCPDKE